METFSFQLRVEPSRESIRVFGEKQRIFFSSKRARRNTFWHLLEDAENICSKASVAVAIL